MEIFTPLNILFLVLALSVFVVSVFICVALYNATLIMRDVEKITEKAKDTVDQVNEYIAKPIMFIMEAIDKARDVMGFVEEHSSDKKTKKKK
ncbi:MAG: hypothetical protein PHU71_02195 [Candidatus Gracilibacteria bacterium]|nr:hypothetical protein [Candidatus Gracilibacteria bacterium]